MINKNTNMKCKFCINHKDKEIYKDIIYISNKKFIKNILKLGDYHWYDRNYWSQFEDDNEFMNMHRSSLLLLLLLLKNILCVADRFHHHQCHRPCQKSPWW